MSNRQSSRVWMTLSSLLKNKSTGRQICDVVYNETLDPLSMPSAWNKVLLQCGLARQGGTSRGHVKGFAAGLEGAAIQDFWGISIPACSTPVREFFLQAHSVST